METAQPSMPSLAPVDVEKSRRDGEYHDRTASVVSSTHSSTSAPNHKPSHSQGYVSPYSQSSLSLTHLANAASKELGTPPDSRRASGEEKDSIVGQTTRQSLPSISEALGIDNNNNSSNNRTTSNGSLQTSIPQAPPPPPAATLHTSDMASPISAIRTYATEPALPHAQSHTTKYGSSFGQPVTTSYAPPDPGRAALSGLRPALHLHTPQAPTYAQGSVSEHTHSNPSPIHERSQHPPPPATAPATLSFGYTPYPPRYASGGPGSSSAAFGAYHASGSKSAWEADPNTSSRYRTVEKTYGESVKRHLDLYDLESALNDIASASTFLGDFSRRYGDLLHQSPRAGLSLTALPGIIEIEDMIAKSRIQTEALIKLSETVLARQAAHDEHKAEMRSKVYNDYDDSTAFDQDDAKGPDAKKRRGRAAPPGRCHSCNRAETPEWRRGPDGARTLCNACGLHYAKLTRKANSAGKSTAVSSSNLRPKENLT